VNPHDFAPLVRVATADDAPWISDVIGSDASDFMKRVTTLVSEHGGFFLEPITSSVLEAHMFYKPAGRGREALHAARAGLGYAFDMLGAMVVFGRIPIEDRAARLFTRIIGFRSDGIRPRQPDGPIVEWFEMRSDSPAMRML
jgi:hypothetical protein